MGTGASVAANGTDGDALPLRPLNCHRFQFKLRGAIHTVDIDTNGVENVQNWDVVVNGNPIQSDVDAKQNNKVAPESYDEPPPSDLRYNLPNSGHVLYIFKPVAGAQRTTPTLRIDNKVWRRCTVFIACRQGVVCNVWC
mgnify:CR=1 FL=1